MTTLHKGDLHLHTYHSGWQRLGFIDALDCYLDPVKVVETALDLGMDYVALTDHNSIGGWQEVFTRRPDLRRYVVPGVEVETTFPDWGLKIHLNVLGLNEVHHRQIQSLRADVHQILRYTRSQGLLVVFNHPLRTLWRHVRVKEFLERAVPLFDGYEVLNSTSPTLGNRIALLLAERSGRVKCHTGGSDAHTLLRVGMAYTVAEGDTKESFLENVRLGLCSAAGEHSGLGGVIADVYCVVGTYYASLWGPMFKGQLTRRLRNLIWAFLLLPGALLMPAFMGALNYAQHSVLAYWLRQRIRPRQLETAPMPQLEETTD